jgi:Na+:H+ antiporter, NhaA family
VVLGMVAGVGFTMSLFVAQLAFPTAALLQTAKLATIVGSGVAALLALGAARLLPSTVAAGAAATVEEAEQSTEK